MDYPRISIVTPSLNQGQYLEETILSVIGQQYPNLEYIIIDGGSTDNSVEIIKKYEKYLTFWTSEKDTGQAHAINKGFEHASGEIFAWINSDDFYLPGVLQKIASLYTASNFDFCYGNSLHFRESDELAWSGEAIRFSKYDINKLDYVIQPSSFWTSRLWKKFGPLDESKHYAFDWEFFCSILTDASLKILPTHAFLSAYRFHDAHKSSSGNDKRTLELLDLVKRRVGTRYHSTARIYLKHKHKVIKIDRLLKRFRLTILKWALYSFMFRGDTSYFLDHENEMRRMF